MSRQNIELVRRMVERWNAGDVEGWLNHWRPDGEWISLPFEALEGSPKTYRGHADLRRFTVDLLEGFAELGRIERARFRDVEDSVLTLGEFIARGRASAAEVAIPMAWLFEVRDGKVARGRDFFDQQQALEALGLTEEELHSPETRRAAGFEA